MGQIRKIMNSLVNDIFVIFRFYELFSYYLKYNSNFVNI